MDIEKLKTALNKIVDGPRPTLRMGCGNNSCIISQPKGMATNGGCMCSEIKLRMCLRWMRQVAKEALA